MSGVRLSKTIKGTVLAGLGKFECEKDVLVKKCCSITFKKRFFIFFQVSTLSLARNINAVRFTSDGQKVQYLDFVFGTILKYN